MFADDIALYHTIRSHADYTDLQNDINSVSACIRQNYLKSNAEKSKHMLISRKRADSFSSVPLTIDGVPLTRVSSY